MLLGDNDFMGPSLTLSRMRARASRAGHSLVGLPVSEQSKPLSIDSGRILAHSFAGEVLDDASRQAIASAAQTHRSLGAVVRELGGNRKC
jgi:hypothetical protein